MADLDERVGRLQVQVNDNQFKLELFETKIKQLSFDINEIAQGLAAISKQLDTLDQRIKDVLG